MLGKPFFWIVNIYRRLNVCIKKEKLLARENYLGAWEKDRARTERFSLCSQLLQSNVSQTNELLLANSPPGLIKTFPEPWVWWSTQIKPGRCFLSAFPGEWLRSPCSRLCLQHLQGWKLWIPFSIRLPRAPALPQGGFCLPLLPFSSTGPSFHSL